MVIHHETQVQEWIQPQEEPAHTPRRRHFSVLAIQSIACGVVVLLALLLRVAGGEAYESLQTRFHQALVRNEWVTALAVLWDGNPIDQVENFEGIADKQDAFTAVDSAPLVDSVIEIMATPPLVSGVLTSAYGERIHPIEGTKEFHTGVDIAAPLGTDLLAVYSGEVVEVGENGRIGKYVRLRHNDEVEILYGHCSNVYVKQGMVVRAGERVAAVGSTGVSTGNHVHIGVTKGGDTCDPAEYVSLDLYA